VGFLPAPRKIGMGKECRRDVEVTHKAMAACAGLLEAMGVGHIRFISDG